MDFEEIVLTSARRALREPSFHEGDINGVDTETADGWPFALGADFEGHGTETIYSDELLTFDEILSFLTDYKFRSSLNFYFNLGFDVNTYLKYFPPEKLDVLTVENEVQYNGYTFEYIPNKLFVIKDDNEHVYRFFDLAQFSYGSLESTAKEWLETDGKIETVDVEQFGLSNDGERVNQYIRDNKADILEYLERDCNLTARTGKEMVSISQELDIPFGKPYSTGYVAVDYLRNRLDRKPGFGMITNQELAFDSYRGGRFEVFKRGKVDTITGYDINSAYPHILSQLPDPQTLRERYESNPTVQSLRQADYGFVDVTVTTKDRKIQPFATKTDKVIFPRLKNRRIQTLIPVFLFALDNGYIEDYEFHRSAEYFESEKTEYPFDFVNGIYNNRKQYEADGKDRRGLMLKTVLNSMYGKTFQTTLKREFYDDESREIKDHENVAQYKQYPVVEWHKAGSFFNPFIASYITGLTRLELHKFVHGENLLDETVMFATDCVAVQGSPDSHGIDWDSYPDGLGGWDLEYTGTGFIVGSGVYCIRDNSGALKQTNRGFAEVNQDLYEMMNQSDNGTVEIGSYHPVSYKQALMENRSLDTVGSFEDHERSLKADFDDCRDWPGSVDFDDLLHELQGSKPLVLTG